MAVVPAEPAGAVVPRIAAQQVGHAAAVSAGFVRDPDRDGERTVKGATWPMVAYRRSA
jgi:hypothetical protein